LSGKTGQTLTLHRTPPTSNVADTNDLT